MSDKYRPANAAELKSFVSEHCAKCANDRAANGTKALNTCEWDDFCSILASALSRFEHKPEFPEEWIYGEDGIPCCTAFDPLSDAPIERCPYTTDIFEEFSDSGEAA